MDRFLYDNGLRYEMVKDYELGTTHNVKQINSFINRYDFDSLLEILVSTSLTALSFSIQKWSSRGVL